MYVTGCLKVTRWLTTPQSCNRNQPHGIKQFKKDHSRAYYLVNIPAHNLRMALTSLRFKTMPSAMLPGRYSRTPMAQCLCICGNSFVEDLPHYVLACPLYSEPRNRFLSRLLPNSYLSSDSDKLTFLLSDVDPYVSYRVALFALAAKKIRAKALPWESLPWRTNLHLTVIQQSMFTVLCTTG